MRQAPHLVSSRLISLLFIEMSTLLVSSLVLSDVVDEMTNISSALSPNTSSQNIIRDEHEARLGRVLSDAVEEMSVVLISISSCRLVILVLVLHCWTIGHRIYHQRCICGPVGHM